MQKLTPDQLVTGAILCLKNSSNLIEEANILLQNSKFNRAYFLYQTAQEEIAKGEDIMWYAHDINIGLSRNFSGLEKSFLKHKRKNWTNFVTLTMYDKESIQRMRKLFEITAKCDSFKEVKEKVEEHLIKSSPNVKINQGNVYHKRRMKARNDSLYVNYDDEKLFSLKSIKKEQVLVIKKETSYLLDNLKDSIKVAQDKKWRIRGKEIAKLVKNYWDWENK